MIDWIKKLFVDQNGDADEMATLCVISVLSFIGVGAHAVFWNHQVFDAQAWGIGLGALIGAASAGMGYKSKSEAPKA